MSTLSKDLTKTLRSLKGLHFLALGGCGKIGMNASFYHSQGQWLMVDNGVTFSRIPDAIMMTDIRTFMESIAPQSLKGLMITHAHEDHVGAAAYLWPYLKCPMYATPFTAYILRKKLKEVGLSKVPVIEVPLGGSVSLDAFQVQFLLLTHSIPEPNALVIRTPEGIVFHTGDWKIDPHPLIGPAIEEDKLVQIGKEGVLALVCDSTNAFEEGSSASEKDVKERLQNLISACAGRVIVSCFSSNLARIMTCYEAAIQNGRQVALIGRSLQTMIAAARHCGYVDESVHFLSAREARDIAPAQLLIITTGSQAEPNAALTRMANGTHDIVIGKNDTVIFSSRVIPGNEPELSTLRNKLVLKGAAIITHKDGTHVSGHPCQEELFKIYQWLKPTIAVPVHGEDTQIDKQAQLAEKWGIPQVLRPHNGMLFHLDPKKSAFVCHVPTGRLVLDGRRLIDEQGPVFTQRRQLLEKGYLQVFIAVSKDGVNYKVSSCGVFEHEKERETIENLIRHAIKEYYQGTVVPSNKEKTASSSLSKKDVSFAIERAVQDIFRKNLGICPLIDISILDVSHQKKHA